MTQRINKIFLNELLKLDNLDIVKVRFNLKFKDSWNPVEFYRNADFETLLEGQYWNYKGNKSYENGQISIGFIRLNEKDQWLLFHIGKITKDLNKLDAVGYEYEIMNEYEKYFGRLIIRFKNKSQNMIRLATSVMDECEVLQILPDTFDNDIFPGYGKVNIAWHELDNHLC